jgi:hypothetical protein
MLFRSETDPQSRIGDVTNGALLEPGKLIVKEGISPETFDLSDAQFLLDSVFATPHPTRQQYKTAVGILSQPLVLSSVITSVLSDSALLRQVSSRSFRHPIGMERITLLATDRYQLRIHTFPPELSLEGDENPHKHLYDFAAVTIVGATTHDIFTQTHGDHGIPAGEIRITAASGLQDLQYNMRGGTRLLQVSPPEGFPMPSGTEPYSMGHNATHRLRRGNSNRKLAATLNLRGPDLSDRSSSFLVGSKDIPGSTTTPMDAAGRLAQIVSIITPTAGK